MRSLVIKRQMNTADIQNISGLLADAERADGVRPLSDHLWLDLRQGGRPGFIGLIATEEGHDHPVAYCQLSRGNDSWSLDLVVHPHHRYDMAIIGRELVTSALEVVKTEGGGHVHWWVFEASQLHRELAHEFDLQQSRELLQLRVALPLAPSVAVRADSLITRSFDFSRDAQNWLDTNNAAFAQHPEQGAWEIDVLRSRIAEPWFDAKGFFIHDINSELAAFCWTKLQTDTTPLLGEIYVIAVHPSFTGRGLGSAITVAGLNYLSKSGAEVGMLFVDSTNTAAIAMYNALGFVAHHTEIAFVGDISQ
ncbi:MAG: mycothiol synthase [Ilumatobacteraceae bacterium]|nr:mycothiol synthase [Ilumatobacteraceae bacterium]